MASENGEDGESLKKRRVDEPAETEGPRGDGLDGEVSEESLMRVRREVAELAQKVDRYRKDGPQMFAVVLDKSLTQMHASILAADPLVDESADAEKPQDEGVSSAEEVLGQQASLKRRLAAARARFPALLSEIRLCKRQLANAITARNLSPKKNLPCIQLP